MVFFSISCSVSKGTNFSFKQFAVSGVVPFRQLQPSERVCVDGLVQSVWVLLGHGIRVGLCGDGVGARFCHLVRIAKFISSSATEFFNFRYWTWNKSDVPFWTLTLSMFNTTVFHLGTVAFGSLIIAIIRFVRAILDYVEKKLSMYNNDLTRCLLWCCKCCLWCLEKFMRFINRSVLTSSFARLHV